MQHSAALSMSISRSVLSVGIRIEYEYAISWNGSGALLNQDDWIGKFATCLSKLSILTEKHKLVTSFKLQSCNFQSVNFQTLYQYGNHAV